MCLLFTLYLRGDSCKAGGMLLRALTHEHRWADMKGHIAFVHLPLPSHRLNRKVSCGTTSKCEWVAWISPFLYQKANIPITSKMKTKIGWERSKRDTRATDRKQMKQAPVFARNVLVFGFTVTEFLYPVTCFSVYNIHIHKPAAFWGLSVTHSKTLYSS